MPKGVNSLITNQFSEYNGVVFRNLVKSKVTSTTIYNEPKTTVKYIKHVFEIEAIVAPDEVNPTESCSHTTNSRLEEMRRDLLVSGKKFRYQNKGFGDIFTVEFSPSKNKQQTVDYGPKPISLTFEPIAGNSAARIVYVIEVTIPECANTSYKGISEWWEESKLSINKSGYQKLEVTGRIEIMAGGPKRRERMANKFRSFFASGPTDSMSNYHLEQDYNFSSDGRILNYVRVYTEIESSNPYPNGVITIKAKHKAGSSLTGKNPYRLGFQSYTNTITCSMKLTASTLRSFSWTIFLLIVNQRLAAAVNVSRTETKDGKKVITKIKVPIVLDLDFEEDIFSNKFSFTIVWVSYAKTIKDAFRSNNMFKPVTGTNWNQWHTVVRGKAQNVAGNNNVTFDTSSVIVNPCNQISSNPSRKISLPKPTRSTAVSIFGTACPPKEASWLEYKVAFSLITEIAKVRHRKYKLVVATAIQRGEATSSKDISESSTVDKETNQSVSENDYFTQDFGNDRFIIEMRGFALRLGGPTEAPEIVSIGGKKAFLMPGQDNNIVTNTPESSYSNCPTYITTWVKRYEILGNPKTYDEESIETSGVPAQFI